MPRSGHALFPFPLGEAILHRAPTPHSSVSRQRKAPAPGSELRCGALRHCRSHLRPWRAIRRRGDPAPPLLTGNASKNISRSPPAGVGGYARSHDTMPVRPRRNTERRVQPSASGAPQLCPRSRRAQFHKEGVISAMRRFALVSAGSSPSLMVAILSATTTCRLPWRLSTSARPLGSNW
jgi:hypothetical protein